MPAVTRRRMVLYLAVVVLAFAAVLTPVVLLNVLVDPYGVVGLGLMPTATTTDRTVKADLIEQLKRPPQLVMLGSSRSMMYEPSYVKRVTGLDTFNGGLNGVGGVADAWAMTRFIHERFPASKPRYIWFVDVESFVPVTVQGQTSSDPRLARYVDGSGAGTAWPSVLARIAANRSSEVSTATARVSLSLLIHGRQADKQQRLYRRRFWPDGSYHKRADSAAVFGQFFDLSAQRYRRLYAGVYHGLDPQARTYFERTLRFMNANGSTPLLVLTPIDPALRRIIGPLGWTQRHRQVVAYVKGLQGSYNFRFVDLTDIATFHGDPKAFSDGVHPTAVNTRRVIDYLAAHTGGAL